jgi:hypothetical protein
MGTPVSLREVGFGGGESPPEIPPHERGRPGGYGLPVHTPLPPSRVAPLSSRRIFAHAGVRANDVPLLGAVPEQPVWLLPASSWPRPANCQGRSTQSTAPRPPTRVVAVPLRRGLPLSKWDIAGRCRSRSSCSGGAAAIARGALDTLGALEDPSRGPPGSPSVEVEVGPVRTVGWLPDGAVPPSFPPSTSPPAMFLQALASGTAHGPDQPVCTLAVVERGTGDSGEAGPTRTTTPTTSPAKSQGLAVMDSVVVAIPARCASVGDSTSPPVVVLHLVGCVDLGGVHVRCAWRRVQPSKHIAVVPRERRLRGCRPP